MRDDYDSNLRRNVTQAKRPFTPNEVEYLIPEIDGGKVVDYRSDKFYFKPSTAPRNPKEGQLYYDKIDRRLKLFTGSEWETL